MEIHIGNRVADVTLVSKDGNHLQLTIDGKLYEVDIIMADNGNCSILHQGHSFNVGLVRNDGGKSYDANIFLRNYHVDIVDTQVKYLNTKKANQDLQNDKIIAPMPGKIVQVPVKEGETLQAGDIAVVLEAMKMQSNYKVSQDCIVKNILVQEGESVSAGQVMVELEIINKE